MLPRGSLGLMLSERAQARRAHRLGGVQLRDRLSDGVGPPACRRSLGLRLRYGALDVRFPLRQRVDDAFGLEVAAEERAGRLRVRAQLRAALVEGGPIGRPLQRAAERLGGDVEPGDRFSSGALGREQVLLGGPQIGEELFLITLVFPLDDLRLPQLACRLGCQALGVRRRFEEWANPEQPGEVVLERELALGLVEPTMDHDRQLGEDAGVRAELRESTRSISSCEAIARSPAIASIVSRARWSTSA